jgi:uncharacterized protein YndB with AHSA1/START domain
MDQSPIVVSRTVACPPEDAFAAFTARMGEWWDPRLTPDPTSYDGILLEARVGGTVALVHHGQDPWPIGEIIDWEPGRHYAQTFSLALPAPTTLSVEFVPDGTGTTVILTHGGWVEENAAERSKFSEWPGLLAAYSEIVAGPR